jgi:large subunit ribosomal protein L25
MAQKTLELKAEARKDTNTRAARRYRGSGKVPAILYGGAKPDGTPNRDVQHLVVGKEDLNLALKKHVLLFEIAAEGGKKEVARIRELQRDALGEFVMHVDFERIDLHKAIQVDVQMVYKGIAKGMAGGGQLRVELYKLKVEALPLDVPDEIVVKIDDMELNQVMRLKDLTLPKGVKALVDSDQVVCAIRPPIEEKEPEPVAGAEGAAAEPEVIGLKSKTEEGEEGEAPPAAGGGEKKKKE